MLFFQLNFGRDWEYKFLQILNLFDNKILSYSTDDDYLT